LTAATPTPTTTKRIFKASAWFARNAISFIFKTIAAAALATTILAIVLPIGFFAMRASQPMNAPQFNGLTFYQYMTWRIDTHNEIAAQYQATHPNKDVKPWICNITGHGTFVIFAPMSEFYTLAGKYPALRQLINPRDYKYIPTDLTWGNLPAAWWTTYEAMISSTIRGDNSDPVVYCRLPQIPPTIEEWEQTH
jgi:hypothetical protein